MAIQTINSNSVQPKGIPNMGDSTEQGDTWDAAIVKLNAMFVELYGGGAALTAGTSTATFRASGNINVVDTTVGSSATNTTQTLVSYVLPANVLANVNSGIFVTAWGRKAGNAAGVTFQLNIGGSSINTGNGTQSGVTWLLSGEAYKKAANSQQELYTAQVGTVFTAPKSTSDTSVDTGTISISVQALDASAAQSNVLLDGLVVEFFG
jgi:hypothetical protein